MLASWNKIFFKCTSKSMKLIKQGFLRKKNYIVNTNNLLLKYLNWHVYQNETTWSCNKLETSQNWQIYSLTRQLIKLLINMRFSHMVKVGNECRNSRMESKLFESSNHWWVTTWVIPQGNLLPVDSSLIANSNWFLWGRRIKGGITFIFFSNFNFAYSLFLV